MASDDLEDRLKEEILAVQQSPSKPLDARLFEQAELLLPRTLDKAQRLELVHSLATLLQGLQQDPTPVINLIIQFTADFNYEDVLKFDNIPYVQGLQPSEHAVNFNRLIISILSKATKTPADAAHVASKLDTMLALVTLWLSTSDTGIASQVHRLLLDLLNIDLETSPGSDEHVPPGGQGLVWKRIFGDRDVYATIFSCCSLSEPTPIFPSPTAAGRPSGISPSTLSKSQRTLAQSRLMEWLPAVGAMDWNAITRSHHPDVEACFGVKEGLLEFAVLKMVDFEQDILMYRCLIDFYADLLHTFKPDPSVASAVHDSPALRYLIDKGLHTRTAGLYLNVPGMEPDFMEIRFVYGPAANYVATYASSYPDHFLNSQMLKQVNNRLMLALDLSPMRWAANDPPKHDLHVIASIPRRALLPGRDGSGPWHSSPMSLLPSSVACADLFNTLAVILQGPVPEVITFPKVPNADPSSMDTREASAARALYLHFVSARPRFWKEVTDQARVVAMTDAALAAINVILAVVNAHWASKPEFSLPDDVLQAANGAQALLVEPAKQSVLSYLVEKPQSFSNLVGGHGDAESAAYKIASAKYEALRMFHDKLAKAVARGERFEGVNSQELLAVLRNALQQGPFGQAGQDAGSRIGTLDL